MSKVLPPVGLLAIIALVASSCAAPPVALFALGASEGWDDATATSLQPGATIIEVARITVPDFLDTQDILTRRGSALEISHTGRWASRLSLGATELLTARLARTRPDALVTQQPQTTAPSYRLLVNISRFDVATEIGGAGRAVLEADWLLEPRDVALPTVRGRISLAASGPIGSDQNVVTLDTALLTRLADAIDISRLR